MTSSRLVMLLSLMRDWRILLARIVMLNSSNDVVRLVPMMELSVTDALVMVLELVLAKIIVEFTRKV